MHSALMKNKSVIFLITEAVVRAKRPVLMHSCWLPVEVVTAVI